MEYYDNYCIIKVVVHFATVQFSSSQHSCFQNIIISIMSHAVKHEQSDPYMKSTISNLITQACNTGIVSD